MVKRSASAHWLFVAFIKPAHDEHKEMMRYHSTGWTTVQWRQSDRRCLIKLDGLLACAPRRAWSMTEKIQHDLFSRRKAFSLFGMTAAFSLGLPVTLSAL